MMGATHTITKGPRQAPDPTIFPHLIQNAQEMWLHWYEWWPRQIAAKDVKGVLFIVSGLGEHGKRYDGFAEEIAEELQFAVFSLDHQGHGLSEGDRKYVENFSFYINDYTQFLLHVLGVKYGPSNKYGIDITQLPRFLLGHSMGGLIALHTARACVADGGISNKASLPLPTTTTTSTAPDHQTLLTRDNKLYFNGVILSGPAIKPDPAVATPTKVKLAKMLSNIAPKLPLGNLNIKEICGNAQVIANAENDFLFAKEPLRARFGYSMMGAMTDVQEHPKTFLNFPLLLLHGELDSLALPSGSADFFSAAGDDLSDKKLVLYKGLKHEIINENGHEVVRGDVKSFITSHMGNHPTETPCVKVNS